MSLLMCLNPSRQKPDGAIANLYWYFKIRDESEQAPIEEKVMGRSIN
jgi:hypothetical protein